MRNKILLMKVTSRSRPETLISTITEYIRLANNVKDMFWCFTFDADDETYNNQAFRNMILYVMPNSQYKIFYGMTSVRTKIEALNRDIWKINKPYDIILTISDDQIPVVKGYDDFIRKVMPDDLDWSLWFLDGRQSILNTQEIQGRTYYERRKYIYHPSYNSLQADVEAHEVAERDGKLIKIDKCIINHYHPIWVGDNKFTKMDKLYEKNEALLSVDLANYEQRKLCNFPY